MKMFIKKRNLRGKYPTILKSQSTKSKTKMVNMKLMDKSMGQNLKRLIIEQIQKFRIIHSKVEILEVINQGLPN